MSYSLACIEVEQELGLRIIMMYFWNGTNPVIEFAHVWCRWSSLAHCLPLLIVLLRIQYYSKQVTEASCNSVSPNTFGSAASFFSANGHKLWGMWGGHDLGRRCRHCHLHNVWNPGRPFTVYTYLTSLSAG